MNLNEIDFSIVIMEKYIERQRTPYILKLFQWSLTEIHRHTDIFKANV